MKKYITLLTAIFIYILFMQPFNTHAQKTPFKKVCISGFSDRAVAIRLTVHGEFFVADDVTPLDKKSILKNGNFSFSFTPSTHSVYMSLVFIDSNGRGTAIRDFIVNEGDSLQVLEKGHSISFLGSASAKFQCQYQLSKIIRDPIAMTFASSLRNDSYFEYLERYRILNDSANRKKLSILELNKQLFDNTTYQILRADCMFDNNWFYNNLEQKLDEIKTDSIKQKKMFQFYQDFYKNTKATDYVKNEFLYSKNYIQYLLSKIKSDNLIAETQYTVFTIVPYVIPSIWRDINTVFTGILREVLATALFRSLHKIDDQTSKCIQSAIKKVKEPFLKNILTEVATKTKGSIAYNFTLPDSSGKMHSLSNYRGKAVVVDFWYTGCEWCIFMASQLKTISAEKDTNVVFITISTDKNKNQWKTSLLSEQYCSANELNLFTNGLGNSHTLIKYYNIHAFPTLLIIDKAGKISDVDPVFPNTMPGVNPKLRQAIRAALQ